MPSPVHWVLSRRATLLVDFLRCSFSHHRPSFHQEQEFLQKQQQELDSALKKIIQQHKHELATVERDCLNHKQQLLRGNEVELINCESCLGEKPSSSRPWKVLLLHQSLPVE